LLRNWSMPTKPNSSFHVTPKDPFLIYDFHQE